MASKAGGSLTLVAAVAVAGLVYGNTDFGEGGDTEQAAVEQPAPAQSGQDTDQPHTGEGLADTLRRVIGQDGAGSSDSIGSFFENTDPGGGDGWSLEERRKDDKGVWDYAKEYGASPGDSVDDSAAGNGPAPHNDALAQLETLEVRDADPQDGYTREKFGERWTDDTNVGLSHNGCDTRNDILGRDLDQVEYKPNTRNCKVLSGVLHDPYTGQTITFTNGKDTSSAVQIDHVVPLSQSWKTGAQYWSDEKRTDFANDPENLIASDGPANQAKGDKGADEWQPQEAYRCEYNARIVQVKATYGLWVTPSEHAALSQQLANC